MNPSVGQILEAITAVNAEHVIVLPNNPNVRLAAENAAAESTKDVRVVATARCRRAIAAAFAFDADADIDANEEAMRRRDRAGSPRRDHAAPRATRRSTGSPWPRATSSRSLDGRAFAASDDLWTVLDAAARALRGRRAARFVQVLRGEGAPEAEEIDAADRGARARADVQWGGQPHYPLLLSAE